MNKRKITKSRKKIDISKFEIVIVKHRENTQHYINRMKFIAAILLEIGRKKFNKPTSSSSE